MVPQVQLYRTWILQFFSDPILTKQTKCDRVQSLADLYRFQRRPGSEEQVSKFLRSHHSPQLSERKEGNER